MYSHTYESTYIDWDTILCASFAIDYKCTESE